MRAETFWIKKVFFLGKSFFAQVTGFQAKKNKEEAVNPFGAVKPGGKKVDGKYWVYKPMKEGEILI